MITADGRHIKCDFILGCDNMVRDHYWGRVKATGWFFSRDDKIAFCPEHVPEHIYVWRKLK